ncbi:monovalent cation/H(+) antiporter subunit G [Ornithinibacillus halophilus]|uniref:Multisubunit sodium/proton antiporter, MrpG subunit n=1 Tax=Ornithinibacillus halophilus TaxID=930117 RepID=A0A1M5DJI5_9BACI|nr:monovalent cation/H(+) antiporter subunit G [Ornithinibacillus halophilus]SHF67061.1 multisubunit sodium/proton antiporter, MrpG subunit [Ornithinibacillus halophilus]
MIETWIEIILNIIIILLLLFGSFFILSGSVGIIRFPDIYTRLHAATKASTLGLAGILIGAFIFLYLEHSILSGKLLLALLFILMTAPISAHMISRAAHKVGVKPVIKERKDAYEEAIREYENRQ